MYYISMASVICFPFRTTLKKHPANQLGAFVSNRFQGPIWWTHWSRQKVGQFKLVLASSSAADWRCPTSSLEAFRSAFGYLSTIQAPPPCPVR